MNSDALWHAIFYAFNKNSKFRILENWILSFSTFSKFIMYLYYSKLHFNISLILNLKYFIYSLYCIITFLSIYIYNYIANSIQSCYFLKSFKCYFISLCIYFQFLISFKEHCFQNFNFQNFCHVAHGHSILLHVISTNSKFFLSLEGFLI